MGSDSKMPAARLGDIDTGHPPAPPTPIITGSTNTFINGRPAARKGDMLAPHHPGVRIITEGSASVSINGKEAARVSDAINCGGKIITGSGDVQIGNQPGGVRNAVTSAEFSEYIRASLKPQNIGLTPKQEVQLAADIAVKYRGPEGAIATWHDYFMGNEAEAGDLKDPAKKEGFRRALVEKAPNSPSVDAFIDQLRAESLQNRTQLLSGATLPKFFNEADIEGTPTNQALRAPEEYKTKQLADMYSHDNLAKYSGEFGASASESLRDGLIAEAQGAGTAKIIGAGIAAAKGFGSLLKGASTTQLAQDAVLLNRQAVIDLGVPKVLSPRQDLHIPPVSDGRSVLTANPSDLLSGLHEGQYSILRQPKPGQLIVDFKAPIGEFWSKASGEPKYVGPTNFGSVMHGKNGVHIVPANPVQW